ncbi:MAG TPA: carboxypeptidase regulatory-like domain-containing protein [Vicinamibacterales bacterium]|nr:carboxypeptidase regulatory-like domain-containing protein [Vicinamibacterales bacterium]
MRHSVVVMAATALFLWTSLSAPLRALDGSAQNAAPQKASISGVVLRAGTSEPVPRAQVSLMRVAGMDAFGRDAAPPGNQNPFVSPSPTATTDDRGRFEFKDVDAASYRLIAARNGFTKQEYGQRSMNRPGTVLNVGVGQQIQDITFHLAPAATISGRVLDGVTGEPLPGITVQALRSTYDATGKRTLKAAASDRTNDLGEYRLYWINPGHYFVSASAERTGFETLSVAMSQDAAASPRGLANMQLGQDLSSIFGGPARTANEVVDRGFPLTYYPGTPDVSRALAVELQPGTETRADFQLVKSDRYRIRGRVIDASTGAPPSMATFSVSPRNATGTATLDTLLGGLSGLFQGNKYDPATGEFEVRDVAPGSYWLQIAPLGSFGLSGSAGGPTGAIATPVGFGFSTTQIPVDVVNVDVDNLAITISPGVSISGRVRMEGATNAGQEKFGGLSLSLQSVAGGGSILTTLAGAVRPATDGTFTIPRVTPGEYRLFVIGLNPGTFVKSARLEQADALQGVTIGNRVNGSLDIVLNPNAGQVEGVIVGGDLRAMSGVSVVLVPERSRDRLDLYQTATSSQDGHFSIRGITPGEYRLFAWEEIEPFSYFNPEVLRQYETRGTLVRIGESSRETAEVRIIPAQ